MNWRSLLILFIAGLVVMLVVAKNQPVPGYMDAEYYYAGGIQLVEGRGFTEPYIWNYLDNPARLPRPSHAYWMPLASILAAAGMLVGRSDAFGSAQAPFLLLTAILPPLTALLTYRLTKTRWKAWLGGLLAVLPGFYTAYLGTTDTFGLYAVLGGLWFISLPDWEEARGDAGWRYLLLGGIAGLMHLSRADGVIWLFASIMAAGFHSVQDNRRIDLAGFLARLAWLSPGYMLVMGPWFYRNLVTFGALISPGAAKALWLTDYNELYIYPADVLTPGRWLAAGLPALLGQRWEAFSQNFQSMLVVQGEIFLSPLILMGLWKMRNQTKIKLAITTGLLTFFVMTVVFPLAGWRGGYFHSGIGLQTLLWAVVPTGLETFVKWGVKVRRWNPGQAIPIFGAGILVLALALSSFVVYQRTLRQIDGESTWNAAHFSYLRLESALKQVGALPTDVVMVNNPPGYYVATRRSAISIPDGDEALTYEVGMKFGAQYVLLDINHPKGLDELYNFPDKTAYLKYLTEFDGFIIYAIE